MECDWAGRVLPLWAETGEHLEGQNMGAMIGILLASALVPATPKTSPIWLTDMDYPAGAKERHEEGAVAFFLLINPEGKVERCSITQSSGFPELDKRTCAAMLVRPRFKPARDATDAPAYGTYWASVFWRHPDNRRRPPEGALPNPPSDLELHVQSLPAGAQIERVTIAVQINPTGQIISCEPLSRDKSSTKLADVACTQAQAIYQDIPTDGTGKPVTMVRTLGVTFKVASQ